MSTVTLPSGGLSVVDDHPTCSCDASSGIPPPEPSQVVSFTGSTSHWNTSAAGAAISTLPLVSIPMRRRLVPPRPDLVIAAPSAVRFSAERRRGRDLRHPGRRQRY